MIFGAYWVGTTMNVFEPIFELLMQKGLTPGIPKECFQRSQDAVSWLHFKNVTNKMIKYYSFVQFDF